MADTVFNNSMWSNSNLDFSNAIDIKSSLDAKNDTWTAPSNGVVYCCTQHSNNNNDGYYTVKSSKLSAFTNNFVIYHRGYGSLDGYATQIIVNKGETLTVDALTNRTVYYVYFVPFTN
jgi:hypothetical protein